MQVEAPNGDDGDSASTNDAPLTYEGPTVYYELDEASKTLDSALFHTLFTIVQGPYLDLITDLMDQCARYSFPIIAM